MRKCSSCRVDDRSQEEMMLSRITSLGFVGGCLHVEHPPLTRERVILCSRSARAVVANQ